MARKTTKKATGRKSPREKAAKAAPRKTKRRITPDVADDGAGDAPGAEPAQDPSPGPAAATGAEVPASGAETPTVGQLVERHLRALEAAGKSRGTVFGYSVDLGLATRHFGEKTKAGALTERKIAAYFEADIVTRTRTGKPKAKPTIDKHRRAFRQMMEWAASEGLIAAAPIPEKYRPRRTRDAEPATP